MRKNIHIHIIKSQSKICTSKLCYKKLLSLCASLITVATHMTDIMQEIQMCVRLIIEVSIYRRYFHRYPQFG